VDIRGHGKVMEEGIFWTEKIAVGISAPLVSYKFDIEGYELEEILSMLEEMGYDRDEIEVVGEEVKVPEVKKKKEPEVDTLNWMFYETIDYGFDLINNIACKIS